MHVVVEFMYENLFDSIYVTFYASFFLSFQNNSTAVIFLCASQMLPIELRRPLSYKTFPNSVPHHPQAPSSTTACTHRLSQSKQLPMSDIHEHHLE
jgi:hypothetical protein